MTRRHLPNRALAALLAAGLLLGTAGCAGEKDPKADSSASPDGSSATASPGDEQTSTAPEPSPPPSDLPTDEPTIETSDGGEVDTSGDLPADFPSKQVPLAKGKVLSVASAPGEGFNINLLIDGRPKAVSVRAIKLLTDAGFKVTDRRNAGGAFSASLQTAAYAVELAATPSGDDTGLNYFVTQR